MKTAKQQYQPHSYRFMNYVSLTIQSFVLMGHTLELVHCLFAHCLLNCMSQCSIYKIINRFFFLF